MRSVKRHTRHSLAVAAISLVAAIGPAAAGAGEFIPGVTDSSTGVLRELAKRDGAARPFIPGVTDSTTGVLRERERRGIEPRSVAPTPVADDSGLAGDVASIALGAAVAAAAVAGSIALVAGGRGRRVTT